MLLPGRAVPDPGVVELCACASTIGLPAKKDNALAIFIVGHACSATGRRDSSRILLNILLPGRAIPGPGIVKQLAVAISAAEEDNTLVGCIVSHAGIRTGRRCYRWTLFNPDLTVPVPGIVEASAAEEHSHAMLRVIGHATPLARGWKHDWIL